ncbi:hypothetical protein KBTX_00848 [wastewater metagenome]|uniref:Colicin V production protein n=2 Tax=unclassified sequences TaxID=12908 RepID=A0A5B8R7D3_9ZZZZ|nr:MULTISPECIES: CvpA family protein [Arhodomonas]MCS4504425.1 CvpA family protein [Arhodomonas aquaeolei]QEA04540.1 hypothetical protein KBTEX_00848 [uncultured organism]
MSWLDIVFLSVIAISVIISLVRGFVRECLSIVTWIAAIWAAVRFTAPVAVWLDGLIASPTVRMAVAFGALFVAVLLAGGLLNHLARQLVGRTGLSGTDRTLGAVFGAARGAVIIAALILAAGLTTLPREGWWQRSVIAAWMTPRVCSLGVEGWLEDFRLRVPGTGAGERGERLSRYWDEFCRRPTLVRRSTEGLAAGADGGVIE